ncbi:MAG: helix-turn-helix domain-containing protein [Caulobacteraceae bacterium]
MTIRTAIIVDDELLSYELLKYLIEKFHLPIKIIGQASAGDEALALIHNLRPDIVFLDIQMPKYNGIEVMEKIKASYTGTIKFIVITAYSYFEYAQASLRLGAKDILLKPIEPKQFIETMERVIGYKYTDNNSFNEILEYVNNNYEKSMGLDDYAKQFHISSNYISRMFKKYTKVSFITYINELRIKKALELLKDTDLSIKEIAQKVGYNNLNYFYKNFRTITGITPKAFRSSS